MHVGEKCGADRRTTAASCRLRIPRESRGSSFREVIVKGGD